MQKSSAKLSAALAKTKNPVAKQQIKNVMGTMKEIVKTKKAYLKSAKSLLELFVSQGRHSALVAADAAVKEQGEGASVPPGGWRHRRRRIQKPTPLTRRRPVGFAAGNAGRAAFRKAMRKLHKQLLQYLGEGIKKISAQIPTAKTDKEKRVLSQIGTDWGLLANIGFVGACGNNQVLGRRLDRERESRFEDSSQK